MGMTHREMVDAAVADLVSRGVRRVAAAPFLYRIFWRLGFAVRPPHYQSFATHVTLDTFVVWLVFTIPFVPFGVMFSLSELEPLLPAVFIMTPLALACGLGLATYYRVWARRLNLPRWEQFHPPESVDDDEW